MPEFSIIKDYFSRAVTDPSVILGSGDDAAIIEVMPGQQVVMSMDTMVEGQHFLASTPAFELGYKAVTSTVSDLAAMGATPKWLTGSLTMMDVDDVWLTAFSQGLFAAIEKYQLSLIGGDLSRGPLNITFQVQGTVAAGKAIKRSGAKPDDLIYVTNTVGDAGLGLQIALNKITVADAEKALLALQQPEAQVAAGLVMRDYASSCIDISDGLLQDLQHILTASGNLGAEIYLANLPLSETLQQLTFDQAVKLALTAGDDYQLLITIPEKQQQVFEQAMPVPVTMIGKVISDDQLKILDQAGADYKINAQGFQHF